MAAESIGRNGPGFGCSLCNGRRSGADAGGVRWSLPARISTQAPADYVVEVFEEIVTQRERLRGLRIVQQPAQLRHFPAQFAPL